MSEMKPRFRTQPAPVQQPTPPPPVEEPEDQTYDDPTDAPEDADEGYITAEDIKAITGKADLPDGLYQVRVIGAKFWKPTEEKPWGGYNVSLKPTAGPDHVTEPVGGWPVVQDRFRRTLNPTAKDMVGIRIDEERMVSLFRAMGVLDTLEGSKATRLQCLQSLVGQEVLVTVSHRSWVDKTDQIRSDINFRYRALSQD